MPTSAPPLTARSAAFAEGARLNRIARAAEASDFQTCAAIVSADSVKAPLNAKTMRVSGRSVLLPVHIAECRRENSRMCQRWRRSLRLLLIRVGPAALLRFTHCGALLRNAVPREGVCRRRLFRSALVSLFLSFYGSPFGLISKPIATRGVCGRLLSHAKHLRRYDGVANCHNIGRTIQLL